MEPDDTVIRRKLKSEIDSRHNCPGWLVHAEVCRVIAERVVGIISPPGIQQAKMGVKAVSNKKADRQIFFISSKILKMSVFSKEISPGSRD